MRRHPESLKVILIVPAVIFWLGLSHAPAQQNKEPYSYERKSIEAPSAREIPERIYSKDDVLYCEGDSPAAEANNKAGALMKTGDFGGAAALLENALRHAPLFLPFRFNLGICYIYLNRLDVALLQFRKASDLLPEYSRTYIQMGYIYDRWGKEDSAIYYYKTALKKNPAEMLALTLTGDLYFKRKQIEMAQQYYERSIKIEPRYPNGLLGLAKIHYERGEFFRAIIQIKSIDLTKEYDKALHYYYAESAFKLRDYQTAYDQYNTLLQFRTDKFFLVNSVFLIRHKMDLSRRFIER